MIIENRLDVVLKPDIYDIFPSYSRQELYERLDTLPFHLATSLNPKLIRRCIDNAKCKLGLKEFFNSTFDRQRYLLSEIFEQRGFSKDVVNAIRKVPRDVFVLEHLRQYSYLNTFIPFSKYSCLSSMNVVALMLESLCQVSGDVVLEIGIGSGYHACCLQETLKGCNIWGVELNLDYFEFGISAIKKAGYNINVVYGNEEKLAKRGLIFDHIYSASAMTEIPLSIGELLKNQGYFVATRPISLEEFQSEKATSWLKSLYPDYQSYITSDWYQTFCCLSTWKKTENSFLEINSIYDVMFVPYHDSDVKDTMINDDPFKDLQFNII